MAITMKKKKIVMYECTWKGCGVVVPESHEKIQEQKEKCEVGVWTTISCPECGSPMRRKVMKE